MVTHDTIDGINRHRQEGRMPRAHKNRLFPAIMAGLFTLIIYLLLR